MSEELQQPQRDGLPGDSGDRELSRVKGRCSATSEDETLTDRCLIDSHRALEPLLCSTDVEELQKLTKQQMLDLLVAQAIELKKAKATGKPFRCREDVQDVGGTNESSAPASTKPNRSPSTAGAPVVPTKDGLCEGSPRKKAKRDAEFDFSRYKRRHVAIRFLYLGWDYQGYMIQEDNEKTIEVAVFDALLRAKLIDRRENSNYHRCGRTDKGVSAFCQVITLDVRSNLADGDGLITPDGYDPSRGKHSDRELDFVAILNRLLPPEIRVIAWAPVRPGLSARFDCKLRTYRYFFPKGRLNIDAMQEAASYLDGEHDFRNLCKMDVANGVVKFVRRVDRAWFEMPSGGDENPEAMCCFCIRSNAFLWHQIRCIFAILALVGEGREAPSIVRELLDIANHPRKPQYSMAWEVPLCLYDAKYDEFDWILNDSEINAVIDSLVRIWTDHSVKATMIGAMVRDLASMTGYRPMGQADPLLPGRKSRSYKPLLLRPTCESLEDRITYYAKKTMERCKNSSGEPTTLPSFGVVTNDEVTNSSSTQCVSPMD